MKSVHFFALVGVCVVIACSPIRAEDQLVDVSMLSAKELGFSLVTPKKDETTGFVVGGKNATSLIKKITSLNGIPVTDLERIMRPKAVAKESSDDGFLGQDESLLSLLANDNDFVIGKLRQSHRKVARPLLLLGYYARKNASREKIVVKYGNVRLRIKASITRGYQLSPFRDGTKSNTDVVIENLANGKILRYSLLVPHMIERYGFYEGQGTPYRVDPKTIYTVLGYMDTKKPKTKKGD